METTLTLEAVCAPSEGVVAREIEGEIIIVPLVSGIGDADDELYTLSETGKAVWQKMDSRRTLKDIVTLLTLEFNSTLPELEKDVLGFACELLRRSMLSVLNG